jgi:hypothetical protein
VEIFAGAGSIITSNFSLLRKAATILLLTVFCNSLFYYGYLSCALLKAKLDARLALAKINPRASLDILQVPVSQLQKDESDEVWYDGKLYDVVERDRINDTLYVFLERDEQEQNVLNRQQKCFPLSTGGHELTATTMSLPISDTEFTVHYPWGLQRRVCLSQLSPAPNTSPVCTVFSETPSPPPKPA